MASEQSLLGNDTGVAVATPAEATGFWDPSNGTPVKKRQTSMYTYGVVVTFSVIYGVFMSTVLAPQWRYVTGETAAWPSWRVCEHSGCDYYVRPTGEVWFVTILFHTTFMLFLLSFYRAYSLDPGSIPLDTAKDVRMWRHGEFGITKTEEVRVRRIISNPDKPMTPQLVEFVRGIPVIERKKKYGLYRFCASCALYKPDRTHHCRICERCVLRMDHHCPWLSNCVGFRNYKLFMLTLFYAVLSLVVVIAASTRRLVYAFRPVTDTGDFLTEDLIIAVLYLFCCFLCLAMALFTAYHVMLTLESNSTIEMREKRNHHDQYIRHRYKVAHLKYNHGRARNWTHVFGPQWYMWFVPSVYIEGDGCYTSYDYNGKLANKDKMREEREPVVGEQKTQAGLMTI